MARIENFSEIFLIFERVAAATAFNAGGRASWNQAFRDIKRVGSHFTTKLNFFYDEQMNSIKVDGHASSTHFYSRTDITHIKWNWPLG